KFETRFVHARLVHRPGHNSVELVAARAYDGFLQRGGGGAGSLKRRLTGFTFSLPSDDDVLRRVGKAGRLQRKIDNLGADARAIAECDANAQFAARLPRRSAAKAGAHARDRNRKS